MRVIVSNPTGGLEGVTVRFGYSRPSQSPPMLANVRCYSNSGQRRVAVLRLIRLCKV